MSRSTDPFRYFDSSPEVIRLVVLMYVRYPLSLRNVEDLLFERGIDICHETVRLWWNRFGPMFAADRLPLTRALERARLISDLPLAEALEVLLSEWLIGQHIYWAVGRHGQGRAD